MLDAEVPHRSLRDKVLFLRSQSNLAGIDLEGLALLAENARVRVFQPGETVLQEGAPTPAVYVVMEGELTVRRHGKTTAHVDRGGGAGFPTLLSRDPHGITAVSKGHTVALEIPGEVLVDAYQESFSLIRNNLRLVGRLIVRRRGSLPAAPEAADDGGDLGVYRDVDRTLVEKMIQVRKGIFERCNLDAVVDLARATQELRLDAGQKLWDVGDPSEMWLGIDYGRVRCTNAEGVTVRVTPPFVLGVMDALGVVPRSYEAVAETPIIAFAVSREALLAVLETHFDLAMDFLAMLSGVVVKMLDEGAT
jgi:CRP-like cAMP-binding protein